MKEEVAPVSFLCVVANEEKLEELDEERIEGPEECEESPVGMVVVEKVEDESFKVCCGAKEWPNHIEKIEEKKLEKLD